MHSLRSGHDRVLAARTESLPVTTALTDGYSCQYEQCFCSINLLIQFELSALKIVPALAWRQRDSFVAIIYGRPPDDTGGHGCWVAVCQEAICCFCEFHLGIKGVAMVAPH